MGPCYGLDVCVPHPKFVLKSEPLKVMVCSRRASERCLGHEGGVLKSGKSALIKDPTKPLNSFSKP